MSALRAAAAASREQYTLDPSNTQALQAWQLARLDLQTRHSAIAAEAALRAGTLWEHYGEQSTFYFHHLARQRQAKTSIASLQDPTTGATHTLDTFHGVVATGTLLSNQFSSDSPTGLFRPPPTDPQAQDSLIGALDIFLQSADVQDCEGDADDPMPLKKLADTVRDMPRAKKSPGADGLSYEFYDQFWPVLHKPFHAMVQETFVTGHLPVSMTKGRNSALQGQGAPYGPRFL